MGALEIGPESSGLSMQQITHYLASLIGDAVAAAATGDDDAVRSLLTTAKRTLDTWLSGEPRPDEFTLVAAAAERLRKGRNEYGPADVMFERTAALWSELLSSKVTAHQVALCMVAVKLTRLTFDPEHVDSWQDVIGYGALGASLGRGAS